MDVPGLLRSAADLVPAQARTDTGLSRHDVLEFLHHDEWELTLDILGDFDGIGWQSVEYWNLLTAAAQQMRLDHHVAWCRWRGTETRLGIIEAELALDAPEAGGRGLPVPGSGQLRPMWAIGSPQLPDGFADLHVARLWVESAPEIPPGGRGSIRLLPLTPADWVHLAPGDVITMHERQPPIGTAVITEIHRAEHAGS